MGKERLRTKTRADDVHDVIKEQEGEYCDWEKDREKKMGLESQMKTDSKPRARS